jgi:ATP-dependent 26S proteasome regulatory subunit
MSIMLRRRNVLSSRHRQDRSAFSASKLSQAEDQTVFLPIIGLVPHEELRPSDLIGVNKDSYLILDKLPEGKPLQRSRADGRIRC